MGSKTIFKQTQINEIKHQHFYQCKIEQLWSQRQIIQLKDQRRILLNCKIFENKKLQVFVECKDGVEQELIYKPIQISEAQLQQLDNIQMSTKQSEGKPKAFYNSSNCQNPHYPKYKRNLNLNQNKVHLQTHLTNKSNPFSLCQHLPKSSQMIIYIQIYRSPTLKTMLVKRTNYNQFKLMKTNSEVLTIFSNITEMILQSRISQHPKHLHRIQTVKSEIQVARSHQHPSDELLYFLIDREYYQIKNKLMVKNRKNQSKAITLDLHFTIFDKETSMSETAEIWKITLNRKTVHHVETSDCIHEIMNLLAEIIKQLTCSYNFSELLKDKETSKKYITDYKLDISCGQPQSCKTDFLYSMWNCKARMNQSYELDFCCFWRPKMNFIQISLSAQSNIRKRNASQETQVDSVSSIKQSNGRKFWSMDESNQAFQIYDSQLDVTIISSDSDSLSNSRHRIQPIAVGEIDQFQLLIQDTMNEQEMFLIQNQTLFQSWQKLINSNFHY